MNGPVDRAKKWHPERVLALGALVLAAGGCALVANYDFGKYGEDKGGGGAGGMGGSASASVGTGKTTSTHASTSAGTGGSTTCNGTCVALPIGWTGFYSVALGPGATCSGDFPTPLMQEEAEQIPVPQQAWCGCTCEPPVDCTQGTLTLFSDGICAVPLMQTPASNACTGVMQGTSARFVPSFNPGTQCKPAATMGIPGLVPFVATLCGTTMACAGGGCAPAGASVCVASVGTPACPPGFPIQYVLDPTGSFKDGRSCTPCTCGSWQQPGCIGGARLWDGASCTGNVFGVPAQGTCMSLASFKSASANMALQTVGSCLPSTSVPTGTVTADNPTTVCCQQ